MMAKAPSIDVPVINMEIPALAELAALDQWVCWKYAPAKNGDGKLTKVPVQANGLGASTTNPKTWATLGQAVQGAFAGGYGVGFVFSGDGIIGIDLDGARNIKTGRATPEAAEVLKRFGSYTEVSPSGTGYHIFVKGSLPEGVSGRKGGGVEIYSQARYFTMTGIAATGSPEVIEERQEAIDWFLSKHFPDKDVQKAEIKGVNAGPFPHDKFDALMTMDDKFRATWLHKRRDFKSDDFSLSTYDMSLTVQAAMVDWSDEEIAALIVRHREQWGDSKGDRQDYLDRTVGNAKHFASQRTGAKNEGTRIERAALAREEAERVVDAGPAESLREIRHRLGIPVKRVVITGIERSISYRIELDDDRRIEIGGAAAVLDQGRFRTAVFETVGVVLSKTKQHVWDNTVGVFHAAAEREDAGDNDPETQLGAAISEYIEKLHAPPPDWDDEDIVDVFTEGRPIKKDGETMVTIKGIAGWCMRSGYPWDGDDIRKLLRSSGGDGISLKKRSGHKVLTRWYWPVAV